MNTLLKDLKEEENIALTANGAPAYKSTMNKLYDLFALGGAYRNRSDEDCILLFKEAYEENPELALKCLFYLRDIRGGGQGERRFFRVCYKWLAGFDLAAAHRNLQNIPEFGRWDDLLFLLDTKIDVAVMKLIKEQITKDLSVIKNGETNVSLCAKWLPSQNSSSEKTKILASRIRKELGMTPRQYRKTLSLLRKAIKIVETQMSENKWNEIEYNKLPSRAGFQYRKAFARHDFERYNSFMTDKTTKVNAGTLYPCDIVHKVLNSNYSSERAVLNKYWDNLTDYFNGASFNGIAVVDTSGSMSCCRGNIQPLDVAISLGLYCADKCAPTSPFYNHYISFSRVAKLVECRGIDFVDRVTRIYRNNICENTNIYSVFDLILNTAIKNHVPAADMPKNIIIISDMQFDWATDYNESVQDTISQQMKQYKKYGYEIPHLIFWNVNAMYDANIPMKDEKGITFVSGYSPVVFDMILKEKTGQDLMLDKLNSERYAVIW